MARAITERTREAAIEVLAACANQESWYRFIENFAISKSARDLAEAAYTSISSCCWDYAWREIYAEAECLLRDGWEPGDEVERKAIA